MAYGELSSCVHILTPFNQLARECTCSHYVPSLWLPAPRLALNFIRWYKWASRPEYAKLRPQVPAPDLSAFINASVDVLKDEREPLRLHFERTRDGLAVLNDLPAGAAGPYHENRLQVARSPSAIAGELALAAPATIVGANDFDAVRLDWGRLPCRWFPGVSDI